MFVRLMITALLLPLMFGAVPGTAQESKSSLTDQPTSETVKKTSNDADVSLRGGTVTVLFDGKTLDGWRGRSDLWSVDDGQIVGKTTDENPIQQNTFLIAEPTIEGQFELTFQFKIEGGNSGVQYLSKVVDEKEFVISGYQADIDSSGNFTGILYEEKGRGILATRGEKVTIGPNGQKTVERFATAADLAKGIHGDQWNDYRVLVRPLPDGGNHIEHFINEALMSEVIDRQTEKAATSGLIALQLHQGPAMTVRYKNISVRRW